MRVALFAALVLVLVIVIVLWGLPARAQDRFEIQVYDAETAASGEVGLETHLNQVFDDTAETHVTFEPHLGLPGGLELGGYFQTALRTDDGLSYAGVKLRLKACWPERLWDGRLGLALNAEISAIPARYESQVWGSELRPIIDLVVGRLYASVNPIVVFDLAGDLAGHPQLEPAAKIAIRVVDEVAIGVESYSAFGPIDQLGSESVERLLLVADWSSRYFDLDLGGGPAWGTPDRWVVKAIVGVHPPAARP